MVGAGGGGMGRVRRVICPLVSSQGRLLLARSDVPWQGLSVEKCMV